jgi:pre-mRNA-splicing helicase BRR2
VLQADRRNLPRRDLEPTGEAESLWGKIDYKKMGDRAKTTDQKKRKAPKVDKTNLKKFKDDFTSVLAATEDFEGMIYRPKTKETKQTYELILAFLMKYLGDVQQEVLRSAADAVIETLKQTEVKDFDKKNEIQDILSCQMPSEQFAILTNLGKKITDFGESDPQVHVDDGTGKGEIDEEYGVAVVFDEESEDEEDFEIKDNEVDEDGVEADAQTKLHTGGETKDEEDEEITDEFTTILAAAAPNSKSDAKVNPKDIDAFWHQRLISKHYSDVHTAQSKSTAVMDILSSTFNARDAENELMALFDYEKFDLVKVLTVNRDAIVWCTKLAKAATPEEKVKIYTEMKGKDLEWIIQAIEGKETQEDTAMDIDTKEEEIAPTATPKQSVDLEALVFSQGGHLMTNKKCRLPEGSFKRSKKGYEEVHVPAPAAKPFKADEIQIKVADMPAWVQPAFPGAVSLNRVQSKVYPIAFEDDENMLLCAPTGAGKYIQLT